MHFLIDPKFLIVLELLSAAFPFLYRLIAGKFFDALARWVAVASRAVIITLLVMRSILLFFWVLLNVGIASVMAWLLTSIAFLEIDQGQLNQFGFDWLLSYVDDSLTLVVIALLIGFMVLCGFWRRFLYSFPVFMKAISWVVTRRYAETDFAKIIDYGYYFSAAIVLFNLVAAVRPAVEIDPFIIKLEVMFALIFLSLKFTKVSLELFPEHYTGSGCAVRDFTGRVLFPIPLPNQPVNNKENK